MAKHCSRTLASRESNLAGQLTIGKSKHGIEKLIRGVGEVKHDR